ncbi:MAG TPA: hypothetical protein VJ986_07900, partial [Gaiellaceae bacterium]|nr:hypothetical protein [Gaiellaceae bacterium]
MSAVPVRAGSLASEAGETRREDRDAAGVVRPDSLEEYGASVAGCTRCRLGQGRRQVVFGAGSPRADLMFVGEAPGFEEDMQGLPF